MYLLYPGCNWHTGRTVAPGLHVTGYLPQNDNDVGAIEFEMSQIESGGKKETICLALNLNLTQMTSLRDYLTGCLNGTIEILT